MTNVDCWDIFSEQFDETEYHNEANNRDIKISRPPTCFKLGSPSVFRPGHWGFWVHLQYLHQNYRCFMHPIHNQLHFHSFSILSPCRDAHPKASKTYFAPSGLFRIPPESLRFLLKRTCCFYILRPSAWRILSSFQDCLSVFQFHPPFLCSVPSGGCSPKSSYFENPGHLSPWNPFVSFTPCRWGRQSSTSCCSSFRRRGRGF